METKEFIEKIETKEAKVLTVEKAKELKGKRIAYMYFGYHGNENTVEEMVVGNIISSLDYEEIQPLSGYKSRAAYWRSYMNEKQLREKMDTLLLLEENGNNPFIYAYTGEGNLFEVPTFTRSDADRKVYYYVLD